MRFKTYRFSPVHDNVPIPPKAAILQTQRASTKKKDKRVSPLYKRIQELNPGQSFEVVFNDPKEMVNFRTMACQIGSKLRKNIATRKLSDRRAART
jgi:hypothetical protein